MLHRLSVCLLAISPFLARAADKDDAGEWIPVINGKNLDGWTPKFPVYRVT